MGRLATYVSIAAIAIASPTFAQEFPATLAASDGAIELQPDTAWNLDYGETRCRLARWFGSKDEPYLLVFEQSAPRRNFDLTIAGPKLGRFHRSGSFRIGMERDEPVEVVNQFGRSEMAGVGKAIVVGGHNIGPTIARNDARAAGIDLDEAASIDSIVIADRRVTLSFATGNMRAPFEALNACTYKLLEGWGLDPEPHAAYVPPRLLDREDVAGRITARYPRRALSRREDGIVAFTVIVETDGSVSHCMTKNATQAPALQSPACEEMTTARFSPARDSKGDPMRSYYSTNITYIAD